MEYIAFVNAVLGGFAIAFLGALITIENKSHILKATFIVFAAAAGCFLIATLSFTLTAAAMANLGVESTSELPENIAKLDRPMSLSFIWGVFLITIGIGMIGWIRSKVQGIATTIIALIMAFGALHVLRQFVS